MRLSRKSKRPRHAGRRVEITALREALADGRVHTCMGLVVTRNGAHFELIEGDVLVELDLMPGEEAVTARMGAVGGGQGVGIWYVPPPGSEVAVLVPDGELTCGPVIVGVLSSGALPDGVAAGVTVISNTSKVLIHDGTGGAAPLATKADVDAMKATFDSHSHVTTAVTGGGGPVGVIAAPAGAMPAPAGTSVLEAK